MTVIEGGPVIVAGGGIGGLTTALSLHEAGIDVDPADVTLDNFQTVDRMVAYARSRGAS